MGYQPNEISKLDYSNPPKGGSGVVSLLRRTFGKPTTPKPTSNNLGPLPELYSNVNRVNCKYCGAPSQLNKCEYCGNHLNIPNAEEVPNKNIEGPGMHEFSEGGKIKLPKVDPKRVKVFGFNSETGEPKLQPVYRRE